MQSQETVSLAARLSGHCVESPVLWATEDPCLPCCPGPVPKAPAVHSAGAQAMQSCLSQQPLPGPALCEAWCGWEECLLALLPGPPGFGKPTRRWVQTHSWAGASVESPLYPLTTCLLKALSEFSGLLPPPWWAFPFPCCPAAVGSMYGSLLFEEGLVTFSHFVHLVFSTSRLWG